MTDSAALTDALRDYQTAIQALSPSAPALHQTILTALAQRDSIQAILDNAPSVPAAQLTWLDTLDDKLKSHSTLIATILDLEKWRSLLNISDSAWWWHFEPPALFPWMEKPHPWLNHFDWLWKFLSLFALAFSIAVTLSTLTRIVDEGVDTTGIFPVVVQAILIVISGTTTLTVVAGTATLTGLGKRIMESLMSKWRIPRHLWQEFGLLVSLIVLVVVVVIHESYLPVTAEILNTQGIQAHRARQFESARQSFRQAIALRPDFMDAHYNLGVLYEDLQATEAAVSEYQLVVQSDFQELPLLTQLRAHNNLGRLYIIEGDYREAWVPLERGLGLVTEEAVLDDPKVLYEQYNLLKNLGWVRVEQEHYSDAELYLPEALDLARDIEAAIANDPDLQAELGLQKRPAAASCLYAQVLDGTGESAEAEDYWKECLSLGRRSNVDEAQWMAIARERLTSENSIPEASTPEASVPDASTHEDQAEG